MRSCDFFIFEAATISIALVIFRVFCTLRIFILISLVPGISQSLSFRGAAGDEESPDAGCIVPAEIPRCARDDSWGDRSGWHQKVPLFFQPSIAVLRAFSSSAERSFLSSI